MFDWLFGRTVTLRIFVPKDASKPGTIDLYYSKKFRMPYPPDRVGQTLRLTEHRLHSYRVVEVIDDVSNNSRHSTTTICLEVIGIPVRPADMKSLISNGGGWIVSQ